MVLDMYVVEACMVGQLEIVKILLEAGANPYHANIIDELPLHVTAKSQKPGSLEIMELLIATGVDVNYKNTCTYKYIYKTIKVGDNLLLALA